MKRLLVALVVPVLTLSGCGGDDEGGDAPKSLTVTGKVHIDDLGSVTQVAAGSDATHGCIPSTLAGKNLVVTDPSGKKVGVVKLADKGADDPYSAADLAEFAAEGLEPTAGVPGTCNLPFSLTVPAEAGVYTASVEGVSGAEVSFSDTAAGSVVIEAPKS